MKTFWIKLVNLLLIVFMLIGYNQVLEIRKQRENIDELNARLASVNTLPETKGDVQEEESAYTDGSYEGEGEGFGGAIKVNVFIEKGQIKQIDVISAEHEDGAYLNMAKEITDNIIEQQSAEVDTISGATFSSTGIRQAVKRALEKAENAQ